MHLAEPRRRGPTYAIQLAALLLLTLGLRLHHLHTPAIDGFWAKQVSIANKARAMAGPPLTLLGGSYDFLPPNGRRVPFTEEVPLYHGILALGYRLFGEQDWFGRAVSSIGSLVAIAAFCGLVRRESDERTAIVAGVLFASCPLLIFYGRAIQADVWMLAGVLLAAYCYRRFLDAGQVRWLIASALATLLATVWKYYGLMVLLPIAEMAWRRRGWRSLLHYEFWCPALVASIPVAGWMLLVFVQTANPARDGVYFIFQQPEVLWHSKLLHRFFDRFLFKGCGPVLVPLMAIGLYVAWAPRRTMRWLGAWIATGLLFYLLLAPKSVGHEYYGLLLLPAAAMCGAIAWTACFCGRTASDRPGRMGRLAGAAVLVLAVVVHSPWVMNRRFKTNDGMVAAAVRLREICAPGARIVAGPRTPWPIVHYACREGWLWEETPLDDWPAVFGRYRSLGAQYVVLYFDPASPEAQAPCYLEMLGRLPVVEHGCGPENRQRFAYEFFILRL